MLYNILDYGAVGDGIFDNTDIIQNLIDSTEKCGGTILIPSGTFVMGAIRLRDNISLYLENGAVIKAHPDHNKYPQIGSDLIKDYVRKTRQSVIFASNCQNIAIKGDGIIDGGGEAWWDSGEPDTKRPRTIQFINCRNIKIEGIKIVNSPCWTINPICCEDIRISNVTIENPYHSPNTDGINPESCSHVKISGCTIDVGDDCIAIKSGLETDVLQKRHTCKNILVDHCIFKHGHGGVVIGSETSGGVRNITVSNCIFENTDRAIRVKTRRKRGGVIENFVISNLVVDHAIAGITFNEYYNWGAPEDDIVFSAHKLPVSDNTPVIRNISISNVVMRNIIGAGMYFWGLPEMPIKIINIENLYIETLGSEEGVHSIHANHIDKSFGEGIFIKNVEKLTIRNCSMDTKGENIIAENAIDVVIEKNGQK